MNLLKSAYTIYLSSFKGLSKESWMLSLVMLINRIGGMVIPFLTVYLTTNLGFTTHEAGMVMSFFGIGSLLGSIIGGWLTDKFGAFYVQFLTLFLASPLFVLLVDIKEVLPFSITILVLSTIYESFRPANSAAIAIYAKKGNLTRSFSLNRMAINLGFSFGPALGGFLATVSYAWLFYGNSLAVLLTAIVFFLYFFKRRHVRERVEEPLQQIVEKEEKFSSPYRDKWFVIFSIFSFTFACVFFQLISIFPLYYEQYVGLSNVHIGFLLGFNGLLVFLTEMIIVNYAERRFNIYNSLIIGCVFLLLSFVWLLIDYSLISCYISMAFLSVSEILVLPFMSTVAAMRSGTKNLGAYMGLNGLSISAAFIVMPFLATLFVEGYSFDSLWIINVFILLFTGAGFYLVKVKMPLTADK